MVDTVLVIADSEWSLELQPPQSLHAFRSVLLSIQLQIWIMHTRMAGLATVLL